MLISKFRFWRCFLFIFPVDIGDLFDDSLVSNCILPCVTTQTHKEFLYEEKTDETYLGMTFSSKVRVTKTDLVKPTVSSFLSEVGWKHCYCDDLSNKILGWRINGPLAWPWSSSSLSALRELRPCHQQEIQDHRIKFTLQKDAFSFSMKCQHFQSLLSRLM